MVEMRYVPSPTASMGQPPSRLSGIYLPDGMSPDMATGTIDPAPNPEPSVTLDLGGNEPTAAFSSGRPQPSLDRPETPIKNLADSGEK